MGKDAKKPEKNDTVAISEQEYELFRALKKNFEDRLDSATQEKVMIDRPEYERLLDLQARCSELEKLNKWFMEQIAAHRHTMFGASSEKSVYDFGQLNLFNEAEYFSDTANEPAASVVKEHVRGKTRLTTDKLPENLPVEFVHHELPPEQCICPVCSGHMREIGTETVRDEIQIIPAQIKHVRHVQHNYACCDCENLDGYATIVKAPVPEPVVKGGFASPEAVAHIMCQKMVMGSPLYRLEQELGRMGIPLSRQTMSNWFIRCAKDWLKPIYDELHERLRLQTVCHCDETTFQVLHEPGKTPQSKSYLWIYRTGSDAAHPIVLAEYQPTRSAENARNFLGNFKGYVHCDGYNGYHRLSESITPVGCWAHCRRGFDQALKVLKPKERVGSNALRGKQFCDDLFAIERALDEAKATPDERYKVRQEKALPVVDDFHKWLLSFGDLGQSAFGKAVQYALNQWEYLKNYLLDGRLEISNNRAERSVKPFVISRKNFLFANTPAGAEASAIVFSIVQTAIENGLDPYKYLVYIFRNAPNLKFNGNMDDPENRKNIVSLLPEAMPNNIKAPLKKQPPRRKKKKK
jgi:transposase